MKQTLVIGIILLGLIGIFLLQRRGKNSSEMKFASTDDFIRYLADQAVQDAQKQSHVHLDYSVDSIKRAEGVLGQPHDQYAKDPSSVSAKGLGSAYGAYVGEVIRRSEPGARWGRGDAVGGPKSYPLIWGPGHSYPMAWCYHRIVSGPEDNVWIKYCVLKDREPKQAPPQTK
jgi:hypothetical protein